MEHTKTPWKLCNRGKCPCLTISGKDAPIANVESGEWGDSYPVIKIISDNKAESVSGELTLKAEMGFSAYGKIPTGTGQANAEFIVKAVNAHDDLLEACKQLTGHAKAVLQSHRCQEHPHGPCCDRSYLCDAIYQGEQAIAKAEPKEG